MSTKKHKFYSIRVLFSLTAAIIILSSLIQVSEIMAQKVELYSLDTKVDGSSYSEWTAKWWQWLTNTPTDKNPALDRTGELCGIDQTGTVWYLAGTYGGIAERECQIGQGLSILFPVIGGYCSYLTDPQAKIESELRDCSRKSNDGAIFQASVDGTPIENLELYRITTDPFPLSIPNNNAFGSPPGNTTAIADGYYVFLKPLAEGFHDIHFSGSVVENPSTGVQGYATDAKYKIMVK